MLSQIRIYHQNVMNNPVVRAIADTISKRSDILFIVFLLIYIAGLTSLSLLRLHTFYTTHDLGIFTQSFWTTIFDNKLFFNSYEYYFAKGSISHFGVHTSPILFLLIPFYAFHPAPETLLIIQTILYGCGAIPLYLAAKKILDNHGALAVSLVYFLYPGLHGANLYDFYEIAFLPLLLGFFLYGCICKNNLIILLSGIGCLMIKEDIPIIIIIVSLWGIYQTWSMNDKTKYIYAFLLVLSSLWLILTFTTFLPAFNPSSGNLSENMFIPQYYSSLSNLQGGLYPRGEYLFQVFYPLLFLPFISMEFLILAVPSFLEIMLSVSYFDITYHFTPLVIPFLFFATVLSLQKIKARWEKSGRSWYNLILFVLVLNAILSCTLFSPVKDNIDLTQIQEENRADSEWFRKGISLIPPDAVISTQSNIYSLLADRPDIIDGYSHDPEYIVLKLDTPQCQKFIDDFPVIVTLYSCIYQKDLFYILKRNAKDETEKGSLNLMLNQTGDTKKILISQ